MSNRSISPSPNPSPNGMGSLVGFAISIPYIGAGGAGSSIIGAGGAAFSIIGAGGAAFSIIDAGGAGSSILTEQRPPTPSPLEGEGWGEGGCWDEGSAGVRGSE